MTYKVFQMRCKHCFTGATISLENDEVELQANNGKPMFIGIQCEEFFEHLADAHDIVDTLEQPVILSEHFDVHSEGGESPYVNVTIDDIAKYLKLDD